MEGFLIKWSLAMLVGSTGGVVNFIYCLKTERFKNNKLVKKFFCDIFGGALIAPIFSLLFADAFRFIIAFGSGLCWAKITQITRTVITEKIEKRLNKIK